MKIFVFLICVALTKLKKKIRRNKESGEETYLIGDYIDMPK